MAILNPRMVVPTQYATPAADRGNCDLQTLQPFLDLVEGMNVQRINGNSLSLRANNLPAEGTLIRIFSEQGLLV